MDKTANLTKETVHQTFERWEKEWKEKHPVLNWIDEKVLHDKGIAGHRGSYTLTHPWIIVEEWGRQVKWAWQRVFRGWDDRVIFDIDYYLAEMLPVWLKELKECKTGIPNEFFNEADVEDVGGYTEGAMVRAEKEWDFVLDKIVLGFESYIARDGYLFETEEEEAELTRKFEEGFDLLRQYWGCFWD